MNGDYNSGTDLILAADGVALGYSSGCKVSTSAETNSRSTKEQSDGNWDEKTVKKMSEQISTEGYEVEGTRLGYDTLRSKMLARKPIDASYGFEGSNKAYGGKYIITSLELDAQAGDDCKWSCTLESSGPIGDLTGAVSRSAGPKTATTSQGT